MRCIFPGSPLFLFFVLLGAAFAPQVVMALSWEDLWKTPYQQRQALEQSGDYEALINSESPGWQGVGHYRSGDYAAAAESYTQSDDLGSLYNQATALTQAGDYDAAIEKFDELLLKAPENEKAAHNQAIAKQLKELQQQNQQQKQDQDGEKNQQQDQSQQQDKQQGEQDQNQENPDASPEQQDQPASTEQQDQSESEEAKNAESEQAESMQEEEQQAEQQQAEQDAREREAAQANAVESDEPLSEDQQAIEQWLRKIPDDPSGLLRRKLIRSHRTDYPDIKDSQSPW